MYLFSIFSFFIISLLEVLISLFLFLLFLALIHVPSNIILLPSPAALFFQVQVHSLRAQVGSVLSSSEMFLRSRSLVLVPTLLWVLLQYCAGQRIREDHSKQPLDERPQVRRKMRTEKTNSHVF